MSHSLTAPQNAAHGAPQGAVSATPVYRSAFADYRVSFAKLVKSEFIKLTTLASTYWLLGIALVLPILFAMLTVMAANSLLHIDVSGAVDPQQAAQASAQNLEAAKTFAHQIPIIGVYFSNLIFASWAVVTIAGEYNTGMIRSTLSAAPKRWPALLAKTVVMAIIAGVVAVVSMLLAYVVSQALLDPKLHFSLMDDNVLRTILMGAVYVVLIAVMAFGLGLLLRNTAGSIVAIIGVLFVLPIIVGILSGRVEWLADAGRFLPDQLGNAMMSASDKTHEIRQNGPQNLLWNAATLWMAVEALVIWGIGMFVAQKRDV
jgi:hypothetical protein